MKPHESAQPPPTSDEISALKIGFASALEKTQRNAPKWSMKKPDDWPWEKWIVLNVIGFAVLILFVYAMMWLLKRG